MTSSKVSTEPIGLRELTVLLYVGLYILAFHQRVLHVFYLDQGIHDSNLIEVSLFAADDSINAYHLLDGIDTSFEVLYSFVDLQLRHY